ncbi:ribosome-associated protein [Xylella fastidiosa subsp. pauca]|nr:ribosome-associated protein [Xylella fastidiosa subsp. pauca]
MWKNGAMRGCNKETGELLGPSRSQQRRTALEVLVLSEKLAALTPAQLAKLPIPERLLPHITETKRITSHIARKRQLAFLAKQMRREDDTTLETIREKLDASGIQAQREVATLHRTEQWRKRLLEEGDSALTELLNQYPQADCGKLRQLLRNTKTEQARNKPPQAFRELYQVLHGLIITQNSDNQH